MVKFKLIAAALSLLTIGSCKNESELKDDLRPGFEAAAILQRLESFSSIMDDFEKGHHGDFFDNNFIQIAKKDTNSIDADYQLEINLGNYGLVCKDGLMRKGKCTIHFLDSFRNYSISAKKEDSFAVKTSKGWEYCTVQIIRKRTGQTSYNENFIITSTTIDNENLLLGDITGLLQTNAASSIYTLNRTFSIQCKLIWNGQLYSCSSTNLKYRVDCLSNLIAGNLLVSSEKEKINVDFDPFGNENCDDVVRVFGDKKFQKTEVTGSTW